MTPERKAWWDSLPKEEKRVRSFIAAEKSTIKVAKATINSKDCDVDYEKNAINMSKQLLKLLRKQIAVRPVDNNGIVKCPVCREILYDKEFLIIKTLCCPDCGQKFWIEHEGLCGCWICSNCNQHIFTNYGASDLYKFCPGCGAKMDEEVQK